jgi:hypothetical protein
MKIDQRRHGNRQNKKKYYARSCNLCGLDFIVDQAHRCFCEECRSTSDLYRYHDWLPEAPTELLDSSEPAANHAA